MKQKLVLFSTISLLGALLFLLINTGRVQQQKTLTIVATTSMIADAVRTIVGDKVTVYCLMGPGIDPHLYRARESDVHKLAAADLVFYNGLHLEGKMGQVLAGMQRFTQTIAVAEIVDKKLLRATEFENIYDPHIWFDVSLWIMVVRHIQQSIIALDFTNAETYKKNGDDYIHELEQLHAYVQQRVNEISVDARILITAHDAFGYFGAQYGCDVVGLQGLSTDCDISTKDIENLADFIVKKQVPAIFVESSIPQRSVVAVQNAVNARGWHVALGAELYSDALGDNSSDAASYVGMVKHNVDAIVSSLVH